MLPVSSFTEAASPFHNSERFSDFTIICQGRKFKAHRVLICPQSKWFDKCCSGNFIESTSREVELHDDLLAIVECMIKFFYKGDYSDVTSGTDFQNLPELHAHVYATAEKCEVLALKDLALKKFRASISMQDKHTLRTTAKAVFEDVLLPETDRALHDIVLEKWLLADLSASDHDLVLSTLTDVPSFASELTLRLLADRRQSLAKMTLTQSDAVEVVRHQEAINNIIVNIVRSSVEKQIATYLAVIAQKDAEIAKLKSRN